MEKYGLIDTGGGQRGIFGAGVLDWCLDNNIGFDHCIGISAGAGNLVSYIAGQRERDLRFYLDYSMRKDYMSFSNLIRKGSYIDLDMVYSKITNEDGEDPLGYDEFVENKTGLTVVATNADTGLPVYLDKGDFERNDYWPLKASSCMPLVCRPVKHDGISYFDGGLSDPVPLSLAEHLGCTKLVVILTRPLDFRREKGRDPLFARLLERKYPRSANALRYRYLTYNTAIDDLQTAEKSGNTAIIAPDTIGDMKTLTKDRDALRRLYDKGYEAAGKIEGFLASSPGQK